MNGKGDTPRPMRITDNEWSENYNRIFRGKNGREIQEKFDQDYWKDCKNQAAKKGVRQLETYLAEKYTSQIDVNRGAS